MIRKEMADGRGGIRVLEPHEPEYWEGAYRYEPYPKWMFHASAGEGYIHPEQKLIKNEAERDRLGSPWAETPDEARRIADKQEADFARLAAERNAADAKMSPKAQAEALAVDRADDAMLPAIPEKPKRKYVKKVKPVD